MYIYFMKKVVTGVSLLLIVTGLWLGRNQFRDWLYASQQPTLPLAVERDDIPLATPIEQTNEPTTTSYQLQTTSSPSLPTSFNLFVPFTSQAPHADWSQPYQDACEEASLLTVHYFWSDQTFTPEKADVEIKKLVAFENDQLGSPDGYKDTDASTTAWIVEKYWPQYQTKVVYDWTIQDVEAEVSAGRPVIVFFYGKALGNPYYRNDGPLYHALVIKGYTPDSFITNDVGTRRGADYVYNKQVLLDASHDWNGGDVQNGRRAILVMEPK
jgi:hypothetical protein